MYQNFWHYAILIVVLLVAVHWISENYMAKELAHVVVFLSYLVIAYLVASSIRYTLTFVTDDREKSVRLAFDFLIGLYIVVTAFHRYAGKNMKKMM